MLVDKAQALAFARRQQPHSDLGDVSVRAHRLTVNDGLTLASTLSRKAGVVKVVRQPGERADMQPRDASRSAAVELAIGARMRTRRRQLGLSQTSLADQLGVSFQQVQKYERGANRIAASTLVAAAQALDVTVAWLVGEEGGGSGDDDEVFRALARPGALEILQAFNEIEDTRARAALLALAQEMSGKPRQG
jgi:transcriptional regulator with XRE-family HTH domain